MIDVTLSKDSEESVSPFPALAMDSDNGCIYLMRDAKNGIFLYVHDDCRGDANIGDSIAFGFKGSYTLFTSGTSITLTQK